MSVTVDHVDLLVDEAERALLWVEGRVDRPGDRCLDGLSVDEVVEDGVAELRLAAAELLDANPSLAAELDRVSERVRNVGSAAAASLLAEQPALLELARLSLETFFRSYPDPEVYELEMEGRELDIEELGRGAAETYRALTELRRELRARLS